MIVIVTQSRALVNMSSFSAIYASYDEENKKYIITDGQYVYGEYEYDQDTVEVLTWMAQCISQADPTQNLVITMPFITHEDKTDDNTSDT